MGADSTSAPINLLLYGMYSQVDVTLNGTNANFVFDQYVSAQIDVGNAAQLRRRCKEIAADVGTILQGRGGKMDETVIVAGDGHQRNSGLQKRRAFVAESREFDMIGRIHGDVFFQERYLLNEVGMKIKLVRSTDAFCLMGVAATKLAVTHASLFVRKVKLSPSVFLGHAKALENSSAKYPIKRVVCKTFAIPQNYLDVNHEKLFSGQLPTRIVVALVDNRAFNGDRANNPFNFHHYNLSEISLYLDGHQQYALKPLQPETVCTCAHTTHYLPEPAN